MPSLTRAAANGWAMLRRMHQVMEGRRAIAQMDRRMLSDIGLSRAEAQEEVSRKPWDSAAR